VTDAGPGPGAAAAPSALSLEARLAAIAHEVATPIAIAAQAASDVAGAAEALRAGGADLDLARLAAKLEGDAQAIRANLARAERLLVAYKRSAAREAAAARLTFPVLACVRDAVDTLAPALRRARATADVEGDAELEATGDPGALAQVVLNLVLNALRHAYRGGPGRVEVRVARAPAGGAEIEVRDHGRGLAPEDLARIFEAHFTTDRAGGGTGLGLAIAKDIVERRLGGTIAAESELEKGTVFRVRIPPE
jgi:signal transduction histidine kinase